jgi:predicted PurR-regulated permease PerM
MNSPVPATLSGIIETALALLLLFILLAYLYTALSIFMGVFTYMLIFSVSFAAPFERMARLLRNKRTLAALIYAVLVLAIVVGPFVYILSALGKYALQAKQWITDVQLYGVPPLPEWLTDLPLAGKRIAAFWHKLQADPSGVIGEYESQIGNTLQWLISGGTGIAGATLEFIIGVIVSAAILARGEKVLQPVYAVMRRIVGFTDGPALVNATGRAIKGVAVGVMGAAFMVALFAWIGFAIAGIPFAIGLAALTFFLVVIQLGPLLVWLPVVLWLAARGDTGWAIFIGIYGATVLMGIDNILKPVLIARSGRLPVLVLFLGVIGGMAAWGFTGMFKGAIILAVFYTILHSWLDRQPPELQAVTQGQTDPT